MASSSKSGKGSVYGSGGGGGGSKGTIKTAQTANIPLSPDTEATGVVNIPIIRSRDAARQLPSYTAALLRSADDHLPAEELDNIQLELERLLSNVSLRYRVLKSEYDSLDRDEKIKDKKSKHGSTTGNSVSGEKPPASPVTPLHNGKRRRDDTHSSRKSKKTNSKNHKNSLTKNSPAALHTDDSMDYNPVHCSKGLGRDHKISLPKNDTPNKFWLSVEPYCMPITNDDVRLLDDLLEQYNGPLVPPIPELGPHYSTTWAFEDVNCMPLNCNTQDNDGCLTGGRGAGEASHLRKKGGDNLMGECVTGPLTQRLVSALIEEQILPNPGDMAAENSSSSENAHPGSAGNFGGSSLTMLRNCIGIENRLKNELIEQGILDLSDFPNNDEDQILAEIKKLISELSAIADYNCNALKRLHSSAIQEIKRLEVKRKLDIVDQEILETYKRTIQNKAKRKPLTDEEQAEIYRLTSEQKTLSEQLDRMQEDSCFAME